MNAIEIIGVTKRRGSKQVLSGVDLSVPRGSVAGLLGVNGSGKTTLLKCLLGLLRIDAGSCRLLGEDAWHLSADAKSRIAYVPQVINIYPWMRVKEYIRYTASFYERWNSSLVEKLSAEWQLPLNDRISALSVGTLQRLAIVTAVGHDPEVLILDEPAASLDPMARRQFLQLIIDLAGIAGGTVGEARAGTGADLHSAQQQRTVLFSTHITSDLERIADLVAVMKNGTITHCGPLEELKAQTRLNLEDAFLELVHG